MQLFHYVIQIFYGYSNVNECKVCSVLKVKFFPWSWIWKLLTPGISEKVLYTYIQFKTIFHLKLVQSKTRSYIHFSTWLIDRYLPTPCQTNLKRYIHMYPDKGNFALIYSKMNYIHTWNINVYAGGTPAAIPSAAVPMDKVNSVLIASVHFQPLS